MGDRVLVTGGAGYIGSHACKALALAGFLPVALDNLSQGHRWAVNWGPLVEADLLDREALDAAFRVHAPVAVLHFAGKISVAESVADPPLYHRHNVEGSVNLLDAMIAADIDKIVFSSTAAVYGEPETVPIVEQAALRPTNPYGQTKLVVENQLREKAITGLSSVSLRYFNAAGSDPEAEIGEAHDPETHLIPIILDVASGKRRTIKIFGDDYDTSDGTCIRDYVHVSDLADAHVLALKRLLRGAQTENAEAFNLGNGNGFSVREIVEAARQVTGHPIPADIEARRPGDPAILVADSTQARTYLGWQPRYADIKTQIGHAWQWIGLRA